MAKQDGTGCAECGQELPRHEGRGRRKKYCSSQCRTKAGNRVTNAQHPYKRIDRTGETQCCEHCEQAFYHRTKKKYCCAKCRQRAIWRKNHPDTGIGDTDKCQHCGETYTRRATNQIACSAKCSKRLWRMSEKGKVSNAKRTAFMRVKKRIDPDAEQIDVWAVFERDGWRCQICGRATPKKHRGTTRTNAPEIDHRVPLTQGGKHTYSNVQTACWECNHAKGNRAETGQFPLFAVDATPRRAG